MTCSCKQTCQNGCCRAVLVGSVSPHSAYGGCGPRFSGDLDDTSEASGVGNEPGTGAADPLAEKLAAFDLYAPAAVRYLIDWLRDNPEQVIAVARGRLITGHYVYGDTRMFEYDQGRLLKEVLEELADGVVYQHLHLSRS